MSVPAYLEARLAELGGDINALACELVREGWHPRNVERVLGTTAPPAETAAAEQQPAPVRRRREPPPPPRERPSRTRLLGPVRAPEPEVTPVSKLVRLPTLPPRPAPAGETLATVLPLRGPPPMMRLGSGPRPDCVHEYDCLSRVLAANKMRQNFLTAVHCPPGCRHLTPPSREQRFIEATAGKGIGYTQ